MLVLSGANSQLRTTPPRLSVRSGVLVGSLRFEGIGKNQIHRRIERDDEDVRLAVGIVRHEIGRRRAERDPLAVRRERRGIAALVAMRSARRQAGAAESLQRQVGDDCIETTGDPRVRRDRGIV